MMKLGTFALSSLLSAAVNEPNSRGRFATLDDRKHYSKNGPNLDCSLLCLEEPHSVTGVLNGVTFTEKQARNGLSTFIKKHHPGLTQPESKKIVDLSMGQVERNKNRASVLRPYEDEEPCARLFDRFLTTKHFEEEGKQIFKRESESIHHERKLEHERAAIEANKNNPVGFLGALTGLNGAISENMMLGTEASYLGLPHQNTPYAITELVGPNVISGVVGGYLYGVKNDNFPTSTPPEEMMEKNRIGW